MSIFRPLASRIRSALPGLLVVGLGLLLLTACDRQPGATQAQPAGVLFRDTFENGLTRWIVEQQPGGTVRAEKGKLIIDDAGGCTVWFRERLAAPVVIAYTATVAAEPRTSDLNCFWMATDPARSGGQPAAPFGRDGKFFSYNNIRTYYVGCGGNNNTTTRFRRYPGDGSRPLEPGHDLTAPEFLLEPDRPYRIELVVSGNRVQYRRDGEVFFDITDPEPLAEGWFAFRTVHSHIEISDFEVRQATPADL